jgi:hypothetical protein
MTRGHDVIDDGNVFGVQLAPHSEGAVNISPAPIFRQVGLRRGGAYSSNAPEIYGYFRITGYRPGKLKRLIVTPFA